jgi:hypothetical protein
MIYFYPTSDVPITMSNVVSSVEACNVLDPEDGLDLELDEAQKAERENRCRVKAFLSVPYILTILTEDLDGLGVEMLKGMDFVSTGGAPLDTKIGDAMVERGVRLVSRLGSSECGCEWLIVVLVHVESFGLWQSCSARIGITRRRRTGSCCGTTAPTPTRCSSSRRKMAKRAPARWL